MVTKYMEVYAIHYCSRGMESYLLNIDGKFKLKVAFYLNLLVMKT
jgi:hypothetical protein